MRFPLTEAEIDLAANTMLKQIGHPETDKDAFEEIRQWISMANAMFEKGYYAGVQACYRTEPDEK